MKILAILTLLFSITAFAGETISCTNPLASDLTYTLKTVDYEHYDFIIKRLTLDPQSCRSRWGCDYIEEVIFTDKGQMTYVQGTAVFQSKRTYIMMESEVIYGSTVKAPNGKFVTKTTILNCQ